MLVVKIELWPHGQEDKAKEIGRMRIANIKGDRDIADYQVVMDGQQGQVLGHARSLPVWCLVNRALSELGF
jgi:hypothetical protein